MSDDGFDDDFDDGFGFYDDLDYQEDDDLSALVDAMAETAFAQGDPIWDEFDAEFDTTEYHSDWSYYSDGGFFSDEEQAGEDGKKKSSTGGIESKKEVAEAKNGDEEGGKRREKTTAAKVAGRPMRKRRRLMVVDESGKGASESVPIPGKITATVIVPQATTPAKKKSMGGIPGMKINGAKKIDSGKDSAETSSKADVIAMRASMKRKPSTDEAAVSP